MTGHDGGGYLRVGITASRSWHRPLDIWRALEQCLDVAVHEGKTLVVVHGDADGGDMVAKLFAQVNDGAVEEPHPADWDAPCRPACNPGHRKARKDGSTYCPAAGNYRNAEMATSGLWRTAAFIRDRSRGTTDAANAFRRAGVPPRVWEDPPRDHRG